MADVAPTVDHSQSWKVTQLCQKIISNQFVKYSVQVLIAFGASYAAYRWRDNLREFLFRVYENADLVLLGGGSVVAAYALNSFFSTEEPDAAPSESSPYTATPTITEINGINSLPHLSNTCWLASFTNAFIPLTQMEEIKPLLKNFEPVDNIYQSLPQSFKVDSVQLNAVFKPIEEKIHNLSKVAERQVGSAQDAPEGFRALWGFIDPKDTMIPRIQTTVHYNKESYSVVARFTKSEDVSSNVFQKEVLTDGKWIDANLSCIKSDLEKNYGIVTASEPIVLEALKEFSYKGKDLSTGHVIPLFVGSKQKPIKAFQEALTATLKSSIESTEKRKLLLKDPENEIYYLIEGAAQETSKFETAPPFLTFQLRRFDFDAQTKQQVKLSHAVDMPLEMALPSEHIINEAASRDYVLVSFVKHGFFHYWAHLKWKGEWIYSDDVPSRVQSEGNAPKEVDTSYMYFYMRKDIYDRTFPPQAEPTTSEAPVTS